MTKAVYLGLVLFLGLSLGLGAPKPGKGAKGPKTFVGEISDSMCGVKHMMEGGAKECTQKCVDGGSKYVLADAANDKVYQLSDQSKPKEFAGQKVKVTGTLKGDTINVASIEAAQ
jgi:hypothetical protein